MTPQNNEPFWLPSGSVRALMHLIVISVAVYSLVVDASNEWAYGLVVSVLGLYGLQKAGTAVTDITKARLNVSPPLSYASSDMPVPAQYEPSEEDLERQAIWREQEQLQLEKARLEVFELQQRVGRGAGVPQTGQTDDDQRLKNVPRTGQTDDQRLQNSSAGGGISNGRDPASGWGE